jgi:hypothetical protein
VLKSVIDGIYQADGVLGFIEKIFRAGCLCTLLVQEIPRAGQGSYQQYNGSVYDIFFVFHFPFVLIIH